MKKLLFAVLAVLSLFCAPAHAQNQPQALIVTTCGTPPVSYVAGTYGVVTMDVNGKLCDGASGGGGGSGPAPYFFSPSSTANSDQHNLAIVTSTSLTVPADALFAQVCAKGNSVNYRWDGTAPTASVGQPLLTGQCFLFSGRNILAALLFIQQAATATLDVTYSK